MAASSTRGAAPLGLVTLAAALLCAGCTRGEGEGQVTGVVSAPSCGVDPADTFELDPSFFVATPVDTSLDLRLQRDSGPEDRTDVLYLFVADTADIAASRLGQPIEFSLDASEGVSMTLALSGTCPTRDDRDLQPAVFVSVSGSITFTSIYDDANEARTIATFSGVRLEDPSAPDTRYAVLDGELSVPQHRAHIFP